MRDGEKDKGGALDRENDFQLEWTKPPKSAEVHKRAKVNRVKKLLQKVKRKK
jgi:hypothetical protein